MANNVVYKPGWQLNVVVTSPAVPTSGAPCRYGSATGVALTDEDAALATVVDFGPGVYDLSVIDTVGGGIAVGDAIFMTAAAALDNVSTGWFFGFALEAVGAGLTATINVMHIPSPGAGTVGAGTIGTAALAAGLLSADANGRAKMANGYFDVATVDLKIAVGAVGEDRLTAAELTGRVAAVVADAAVIGGLPVVHRIDIADAAANTDVVLTHKTKIIDFWFLNTGVAAHAATDTIQLLNAANPITAAIPKTATVNAIIHAPTMDPAFTDIAAGGTLRIAAAKGAGALNVAVTAFVLGVRVA